MQTRTRVATFKADVPIQLKYLLPESFGGILLAGRIQRDAVVLLKVVVDHVNRIINPQSQVFVAMLAPKCKTFIFFKCSEYPSRCFLPECPLNVVQPVAGRNVGKSGSPQRIRQDAFVTVGRAEPKVHALTRCTPGAPLLDVEPITLSLCREVQGMSILRCFDDGCENQGGLHACLCSIAA